MTTETTSETVEIKRKRGRPAGSKNKSGGDSRDAEIANLREQLAAMAQGQGATLAAIPPSSAQLPPGSYVKIGKDGNGADILGKVRWTFRDLDERYPKVQWTPTRTMSINPFGLHFQVEANVPIETPAIVKDIFDETLASEKREWVRTRPETPDEKYAIAVRASEQPGRHWTRLTRMGYGLSVRVNDPGEEGGLG